MHSTNKFFLPLLVICLVFALSTGSNAKAQKKWGGLETVPRFDPNSRVLGAPIEEKGTANIPPRTSSPRPGASDLGLQFQSSEEDSITTSGFPLGATTAQTPPYKLPEQRWKSLPVFG